MTLRIIYVARHNQANSNDDEGAIAYALEQLGHKVDRVPEAQGHTTIGMKGDLVLFHKWSDVETLSKIKIPKVFWYFDLVAYRSDPSLQSRCLQRIAWMKLILPIVDLGFCTDGDWVDSVTKRHKDYGLVPTSKIFLLRQGADERITKLTYRHEASKDIDILFTGISAGGGIGRIRFINEMREKYGMRFHHVSRGCHGSALADLISRAKIVIAPDSPTTDRYWSNRVYLTLGFGGFLLHPNCKQLHEEYAHHKDLVFYENREHLHQLIGYYLHPTTSQEKARVSSNGYNTTINKHLYRDRCREMLEVVSETLGIGK